VTQLGDAIPGRDATIVDGDVRTVDPVWASGDPRSTPSGTKVTYWRFDGDRWVEAGGADDQQDAPDQGGDLPRVDGYGTVGAGCSPEGPVLGDGWWFGYASTTPTAGRSFQLDVACFTYEEMADVEHGHDDVVVANDEADLVDVQVAPDARFSCSTILDGSEQPCGGPADPAVWVLVEGGSTRKVVTQLWWE
jgi:hypothetical protein